MDNGRDRGDEMGKKREKRLTLMCGLPEDVPGGTRVTMFGHRFVMIEGQRGMVQLGENCMRLRTGSSVLTVLGQALEIRELSADAAMIAGERIDTVTYVRMTQD